ncbi:hypothetical protein EDD29_8546 [Actinocorallia herbida]|uniref:Uncharacterized protein n=1 Tax=Actinocorallia herbida TaxID=58109 RepID=A0A3N1DBA0_9ACTN|nr:hypothetical protein [Actinocorallia herbida]ROO90807.1 hypothetical protein EDD29_8546 [Actinocorallia herbida]
MSEFIGTAIGIGILCLVVLGALSQFSVLFDRKYSRKRRSDD